MGEIADMMINGDMDYITGEWIGNGQGCPRTNHKKHRQPNAKKGVTNWLERQGITDKQEQTAIMRSYVKNSTPHSDKKSMCVVISCNWHDFLKWFKQYKQSNP